MTKNPFIIFEKKHRLKDGLVKNYTARQDEGNFLDYYNKGRPINPLINHKKITTLFCVFILLFLGLLVRVLYLQIFKGEHYLALAEGNRIRQIRQKANRGVIYDRHGNPLLKNKPNFSLLLTPSDLPKDPTNLKDTATWISEQLNIDYPTIWQTLNDPKKHQSHQNIIIQDNLSYEATIKLMVELNRFKGLSITQIDKREYTQDTSLSHMLGYLGKINEDEWNHYQNLGYSFIDDVGKMGLELFYEQELKGQDGQKKVEVDASGQTKKIINETQLEHGHNLILTIDTELQNYLATNLNLALTAHNAHAGAGIILNPHTGQILAMASLPNFDNNLFAQGISQKDYQALINNDHKPLFNRSTRGEYPPGSTFKLIVAASALKEKLITQQTGFNSTGGLQVNEWFFPDWQTAGHGYTQITKALAQSVNTFFYYIGGGYENFEGLGVAKITDYARQFGLGQKTGIDLTGENTGFLPSKQWKQKEKQENWYVGDTYHLSIGQGDILVTPLQVANFTAAFTNGGRLYKPFLVQSITNHAGETVKTNQPHILNENFMPPEHINTIKRGLREAVTYGSAKSLNDLNTPCAGKTGTAQAGGDKQPHSWFTAFAPYDDPEIVITILIEHGGEGSTAALPVAKQIINYYFNTLKN